MYNITADNAHREPEIHTHAVIRSKKGDEMVTVSILDVLSAAETLRAAGFEIILLPLLTIR